MAGIPGSGGKKGRSGRKSKAVELGLPALLEKCWSQESRELCIQKLAQDAESEDFHIRNESRKLLLAYTFGKPRESVEHSGEGGGPIEVIVRYVSKATKG